MTKYSYLVYQGDKGIHTVITRLHDGEQKYFFQASGTVEGMKDFLNSMTDELVDGYFPKPDKKGKSPVDNWAFLGFDIDRHVAGALARVEYTVRLRHEEIRKHFGWSL